MITIDSNSNITVSRLDRSNSVRLNADFRQNDYVEFNVVLRGNYEKVLLHKELTVEEDAPYVFVELTDEDLAFGNSYSNNEEFWYEVRVNRRTVIGHELDGPRRFFLSPSAKRGDVS